MLFASEIKCLLCDPDLPRDLDLDAFGRFLALGWIPGEATPFRAIRRVRPGCRVVLEPGTRKDERYWAWPRFFPRNGTPEPPIDVLADQVGSRIAESVVSMLLSTVRSASCSRVASILSLLVALLPEAVRRETRTFSIGFEGAGYHDERPYARAVAERFGTRHREFTVPIDVARELPRITEFSTSHWPTPPRCRPTWWRARRRPRSPCCSPAPAGTRCSAATAAIAWDRCCGAPASSRARWRGPAPALLTERDQHRRTRAGERMVMVRKLLEARSRPRFIDAYLSAFEPAPPGALGRGARGRDRSRRRGARADARDRARGWRDPRSEEELAFTVDHLYYLPDDLLLKEDRTTMGASVEGRVPYLDHPLVEFAAGLSLASRLDGGNGKQLLRVLARRHLPPEISERPKHGFSVPIEDWLRGPLDTLVGDVFAGSGSGMFRMDVLRRWHEEHRARRDRSGPLWAALSFELWWSLVGSAPRLSGSPMAVGRSRCAPFPPERSPSRVLRFER